ncbi:MAG: ABC transporter ATP-binding protein [Chloroflexota bacterium]
MLTVKNVSYQYERVPVLQAIDMSVESGEIVCLLGESGSGKTTLLRVIAGLETGYTGEINLEGQILRNIPIHQRGFGLMFQDFALFPHMTVAQNVAFGLRMQGISKAEQQQAVDEMLDLVGLAGYQDRSIDALSGGQKQRVALARSLAPKPRLLMLDEPLGSLDAGLRDRLLAELGEIIRQIGLTAIYVTHDQQEAYAIADRIAIMNEGQIEQYDTPEILYHQPKSQFVAQFLGLTNIVPSTLLPTIPFDAPHVLLHPNSLHISDDGALVGKLIERTFQGEHYRLIIQIKDDVELRLNVSSSKSIPQLGDSVLVAINTDRIHPLYL